MQLELPQLRQLRRQQPLQLPPLQLPPLPHPPLLPAPTAPAPSAPPAATLHLPPLQWLSVFFGKAAPQPGHVVRRLWTFREQAGQVFIDGARLGLGTALVRGGASSTPLYKPRTSAVRRADSWAQKPPVSVDVGFGAGGW